MHAYLVQHGEATTEQEDPARPLTERGRLDVARVARAAARAGVRPHSIFHSGKLRAQQTAEVLAAEVRPEASVQPFQGITPNDDPHIAARALAQYENDVVLVGHLPHLSRLASLLLSGDPARELVAFRMGGMVCLERDVHGAWWLAWILTPELLP